LLKYGFDQNVTEFTVLNGLLKHGDAKKIKQYGFSLLDLKKYAIAQGYQSTGFKITVDKLTQLQIPAIALIDVKGYKHFVVVKRVIGGKVYIADPALGNRAVLLEDFSHQWNNIVLVVVGKNYDKNSILANPKPPISAAHLQGLSPSTNATSFDFGPGRSNLF
jgi:predicted double-glycine peptidase